MSTDRGNKRLLSPGSATIENPEDKRQKGNNSSQINDIQPLEMEALPDERDLTLADIKRYMDNILTQVNSNGRDIQTLATKNDLKEINDQITAHGTEIDQLKDELKTLKLSIQGIEENVDLHLAQKVDRMSRTAGLQTGRPNYNMAPNDQNKRYSPSTKRRNLVFEGLPGQNDDEIKANIIKVAEAVRVGLFANEIESVTRIKRRDDSDVRPGPVVATFSRVILRDSIITKKAGLRDAEGMSNIFVNADEPLQVRRAKAMLRKAAYMARGEGCEVEMRHDRIRIDNDMYTVENVYSLPKKYLATASVDGALGGQDIPTSSNSEMEEDAGKPKMVRNLEFTIKPGENMRLSKKGILFSGPTAFVSNLSRYPIRFEDRDYNSNEQGFQWTKATRHDEPEIAEEIMKCKEPFDILYAGADITTSPEWNRNSPLLLATLFHIKMERHPELLQRLISTSPHRLIEASSSKRWGGGAPISSGVYDTDKPLPGSNVFGEIATNYRDKKIVELFPDN